MLSAVEYVTVRVQKVTAGSLVATYDLPEKQAKCVGHFSFKVVAVCGLCPSMHFSCRSTAFAFDTVASVQTLCDLVLEDLDFRFTATAGIQNRTPWIFGATCRSRCARWSSPAEAARTWHERVGQTFWLRAGRIDRRVPSRLACETGAPCSAT